jgi:hypothetical protein
LLPFIVAELGRDADPFMLHLYGRFARLMVTDPRYGVNYDPKRSIVRVDLPLSFPPRGVRVRPQKGDGR